MFDIGFVGQFLRLKVIQGLILDLVVKHVDVVILKVFVRY